MILTREQVVDHLEMKFHEQLELAIVRNGVLAKAYILQTVEVHPETGDDIYPKRWFVSINGQDSPEFARSEEVVQWLFDRAESVRTWQITRAEVQTLEDTIGRPWSEVERLDWYGFYPAISRETGVVVAVIPAALDTAQDAELASLCEWDEAAELYWA